MGDRITTARTVVAGAAAAILALAPAGAARAQTVIGGSGSPSVSVDMSVLDSLGPAPTVPDLLMPNHRAGAATGAPTPAGRGRIALHPPDEQASGRVHLRRPSRARTRQPAPARKKPAVTAARPAAPAPPRMARRAPEPVAPPPAMKPAPPSPAPAAPPQPVAKAAPSPPPMRAAPAAPKAPEPAPPAPPATASAAPPAPPPPPAPPTASAAAAPEPPAPPAPPKAETASLAPARSSGRVSLPFAGDSANLADSAKATLDGVAARVGKDDSLRLQLVAYASGSGDTASRARRLSLSRALAVRSYLIDKGVRSTRIDVRALGNRVESGPPDRVDVVVTQR